MTSNPPEQLDRSPAPRSLSLVNAHHNAREMAGHMGPQPRRDRRPVRLRAGVRRLDRHDQLPGAQRFGAKTPQLLPAQPLRGPRTELLSSARGDRAARLLCVPLQPSSVADIRPRDACARRRLVRRGLPAALGALLPGARGACGGAGPLTRPRARGALDLAGGPGIGVPLVLPAGAVAAATWRERLLPSWIGWLSLLAALFGAASAATMLGPANNSSAIYGILLLAALLMFAWLIATSLALAARPLGQTTGP